MTFWKFSVPKITFRPFSIWWGLKFLAAKTQLNTCAFLLSVCLFVCLFVWQLKFPVNTRLYNLSQPSTTYQDSWWQLAHESFPRTADDSLHMASNDSLRQLANDRWYDSWWQLLMVGQLDSWWQLAYGRSACRRAANNIRHIDQLSDIACSFFCLEIFQFPGDRECLKIILGTENYAKAHFYPKLRMIKVFKRGLFSFFFNEGYSLAMASCQRTTDLIFFLNLFLTLAQWKLKLQIS